METITVPRKVYEEMNAIKEDNVFLSSAFEQLHVSRHANAYDWLHDNMYSLRIREYQFTQYFYNELEFKPEQEKKYRVYKEWYIDNTTDSHAIRYCGLDNMYTDDHDWMPAIYGRTTLFDELTPHDIDEFEKKHGVRIPEDWIHEVDAD